MPSKGRSGLYEIVEAVNGGMLGSATSQRYDTMPDLTIAFTATTCARMALLTLSFWAEHLWTAMSLCAAVLVFISSFADHRRQKRMRINDVGFMPWTAITVFSVLATVLAAASAIKAGEFF